MEEGGELDVLQANSEQWLSLPHPVPVKPLPTPAAALLCRWSFFEYLPFNLSLLVRVCLYASKWKHSMDTKMHPFLGEMKSRWQSQMNLFLPAVVANGCIRDATTRRFELLLSQDASAYCI
jgi:hypothetical protein